MLPIAGGMIFAARASVLHTRCAGTKLVVAAGLAAVAGAMVLVTGFEVG